MPDSVEMKYLIYAEDDQDDQEIMRDMITEVAPDLTVITTDNGLDLIHYLNALLPDEYFPCFIVLDMNMPVWNGVRTLEALKADHHYREIPVVMFSTSNMQKDIDLAVRLGAEEFITKPLRHIEIEEVTKKFAAYCKQLPIKRKQHA